MTTTTMSPELQQKKRKQIIILAVVGGLLLLLLVFQGSRMLGSDDSPAASEGTTADSASGTAEETTSTTSTTSSTGAGVTTTEPTTTATLAIPAGKALGTTYLAGVVVPGGFAEEGGEGRLLVFNQMPVKDPFVQQVGDTPVNAGGGDGSDGSEPANASSSVKAPSAPVVSGKDSGTDGPSASGGTTVPSTATGPVKPPKPPVLTFATISVNGTPVAVEVKTPFPSPQNLFVVRKLSETEATLAIAGEGAFAGKRDTVILKMGKSLTLVDQATGVRYTLKLLYTGTTPEETAEFTSPGAK